MMTVEEMKIKKKECGYSYETVARRSGLPLGTVQKVLGGISKTPREQTLRRLETAFIDRVAETATNYAGAEKKQGEYTLTDYLALPDERRVEMIDGVFYDMSSPYMDHQLIAGEIHAILRAHINSRKGSCVPFIAPADVQLDCDDKTIVQPDVFVVCDRTKIHGPRIFGAPDLVIEVLSKSTRKKDMYIKAAKYQNAGVREYWMVDPQKETILVFRFENDDAVALYHFTDRVPVGIFDNELEIDFPSIKEYISFLQE